MSKGFDFGLSAVRKGKGIRDLLAGTVLHPSKFVQVIFVDDGADESRNVDCITGMRVDGFGSVLDTIERDMEAGIRCFMLFCIVKNSDEHAEFTSRVVSKIKLRLGREIFLICDVCMCGYSDDGHCGFIDSKGFIDNKKTVFRLVEDAVAFAKAGADCVAPSDMQDGRVGAIRDALSACDLGHVVIMSYSTKFSSEHYGAFRGIYNSFIDQESSLKTRKTYQVDLRNLSDAVLSSLRDQGEGAHVLMVKPAIRFLDVIRLLSSNDSVLLPVAAFQVASECVALELLADKSYGNLSALYLEDWFSIQRAGASFVISYAARLAKQWIEDYYQDSVD